MKSTSTELHTLSLECGKRMSWKCQRMSEKVKEGHSTKVRAQWNTLSPPEKLTEKSHNCPELSDM